MGNEIEAVIGEKMCDKKNQVVTTHHHILEAGGEFYRTPNLSQGWRSKKAKDVSLDYD